MHDVHTASTRSLPTRASGKVYLIGAGPGDPELLTLKAVRALGEADIVLVDALVNRAMLIHACEARIVDVGKRGGCRSTSQAFIEKLMVRLAKAGHTVARLKGGDPFVFGRGGEEMLALRRAGVRYEVVSGVTAGIAAPASIGIPITHRGAAQGVTFITAHSGQPLDWHALAASKTTLVFYMGLARLHDIVDGLLAAGMPGATPAAVVQQGTLPARREVVATLSRLAPCVAAAQLAAPALVVVGDVVAFAQVAGSTAVAVPGAEALAHAA